MKRDQALKTLADYYPDGIVVPVYQAAFDWMGIRPHALNYLCTGAMGQASSHALGLALACPQEKVVVLDGDGSLLMNLGSLVTIGTAAPENLIHFVIYNGLYEVNGHYPVPGGTSIHFADMASAAGYRRSYRFRALPAFEAAIVEILTEPGPIFVELHAEQGEVYPKDYVAIHSAASRARFRDALRDRVRGS
ncbi:MAG: thiamine pyrophosphate-dependent enzyme [Pseudomonadota bacterium]